MQNIIFALLLIGLNIILFILLSVNFNVGINKNRLRLFLVPLVLFVVVFFILDPERYRATFYMSAALFGIMSLRYLIYKFIAVPPEHDTKGARALRKFFDLILFPFFVLFISFAQCMFLFVWNS